MNTIDKFDGRYEFLSNFYPVDIEYDGQTYGSVEHAFQAAKTFDEEERRDIRYAISPGIAKRIGRHVNLRPDWNNVKINIMYELLLQKFSRPRLRKMLLDTDDARIIEGNTWHDTFWGMCHGIGENNLGKLLEKVREDIR